MVASSVSQFCLLEVARLPSFNFGVKFSLASFKTATVAALRFALAPAIYLARKISSRVVPISAGQALASSMIWSILLLFFVYLVVKKCQGVAKEKARLDNEAAEPAPRQKVNQRDFGLPPIDAKGIPILPKAEAGEKQKIQQLRAEAEAANRALLALTEKKELDGIKAREYVNPEDLANYLHALNQSPEDQANYGRTFNQSIVAAKNLQRAINEQAV
jgi:hypothetical protein